MFLATNPKFGATLSCLEHTRKDCSHFISDDDDADRFSLSFFLPITTPFSTTERHRFRYNNRLSVMMAATSKKFPFGPLSSLLGAIVLPPRRNRFRVVPSIYRTNEEETRRQAENLISSIPAFQADFCGDRIQNKGPQNWPGRGRKIGRINVWWMLRWTIKEPSTTTSSRKKQKAVEKLWWDTSELEQQEKKDAFSVLPPVVMRLGCLAFCRYWFLVANWRPLFSARVSNWRVWVVFIRALDSGLTAKLGH